MPIDPTIPLMGKPMQLESPTEQMGKALQLRGMAQGVQEQQGRIEAQQTMSRNEQALRNLFATAGDKLTANDIYRVVGPDRGKAIISGLEAFHQLQTSQVANARETAGRLALGIRALPPGMQAEFWPRAREAAIAGGLGDAESVPEQITPEFLEGVIAWSTGKEEKPEKITYSGAKRFMVGGKPVLAREGSDGFLYDVRDNSRIQSDEITFDDAEALTGGDSDYARYLMRAARDKGKTVAQLTAGEEEALRTKFYATSRAPERTGSGGGGRSGGAAARNPRGAGSIPQGVERYILDMRGRGYTQRDAVDELLSASVWANMQRDHPSMTAQQARAAVAALIPEEGAAVPAGAGARPASAPAGGGDGAQTISLAELKAAAERLGIPEADARREYEQRGFVIR